MRKTFLVCPDPVFRDDPRHVCDTYPDYDRPMLDAHDEVCYPFIILIMRCVACGVALAPDVDTSGEGRWGRYVITEEPW